MAKLYGTLVGQAYNPGNATPRRTNHAHEKGTDHVLIRDTITLAAAPVNDTISLGKFGSNAFLDPECCMIRHDDLGATTTLDIGREAIGALAAAPQALITAQDVSTAAGSFSLFKSVPINNYFKPLWQVLGLASDPGGEIELIATIKSSAATGTVVWSFKGQNR